MFLSPVFSGEPRGQRPDVGNGIASSLIASHVDAGTWLCRAMMKRTELALCCDRYQRGMGMDGTEASKKRQCRSGHLRRVG